MASEQSQLLLSFADQMQLGMGADDAAVFAMSNIPKLPTRQALLVLDLQNDFLSADGKLPVLYPPEYVARIKALVPAFRKAGDVIWVRTEFHTARVVNDVAGQGESVVTDDELPSHGHAGDYVKSGLDIDAAAAEADIYSESFAAPVDRVSPLPPSTEMSSRSLSLFQRADSAISVASSAAPGASSTQELFNECFLTPASSEGGGTMDTCCLPGSFGARFAPMVDELIDTTVDQVFTTSYYSAFKAHDLLPLLRGSLVTELFICGVLSNVSVYATALDAARHGYTITLLQDCLGYRSRARHGEAMRLMIELMGADTMTSSELMQELGVHEPPALNSATQSTVVHPNSADGNLASSAMANPGVKPADTISSVLTPDSSAASPGGRSISNESVKARPKPSTSPKAEQLDQVPSMKGPDAALTANSTTQPMQPTAQRQQTAAAISMQSAKPSQPALKSALVAVSERPPDTPEEDPNHASADLNSLPASASGTLPLDQPSQGRRVPRSARLRPPTVLGPGSRIGEGDCSIIHNLLPQPLSDDVFERLRQEVHFRAMHHRGGEVPRLVAVQGEVGEDGSMPVYRHPADESPPLSRFTPVVSRIRDVVQQALKHPINHVLIQYYRDGQDHISEHSDKTLDIMRGSKIANVSIGAQRTMILRSKKAASSTKTIQVGSTASSDQRAEQRSKPGESHPRPAQRIPMPHNSMFVLGLTSNMRLLHGIRPDKRPLTEKSVEEVSYGGQRISLTFRHIGTFLHPRSNTIWGQGARSKERATAGKVVAGGTAETERMLAAFGRENQEAEFDWDDAYGEGFDALDILPARPKLYLCRHNVLNRQVQLHLAECGLDYDELGGDYNNTDTTAGAGVSSFSLSEALANGHNGGGSGTVRFVDGDVGRAECFGALPIIFYLEKYHRGPDGSLGAFGASLSPPEIALTMTRVGQMHELTRAWDRMCHVTTLLPRPASSSSSSASSFFSSASAGSGGGGGGGANTAERLAAEKALHRELATWEERASRFAFIACDSFTVADSAFWPVLHDIVTRWADWDAEFFASLKQYYDRVRRRPSVRQLKLDGDDGDGFGSGGGGGGLYGDGSSGGGEVDSGNDYRDGDGRDSTASTATTTATATATATVAAATEERVVEYQAAGAGDAQKPIINDGSDNREGDDSKNDNDNNNNNDADGTHDDDDDNEAKS
jgi:nicotinamidase-related amidase/alkylated DNA repair dioxygenase AlkB/glutathione S-transferase